MKTGMPELYASFRMEYSIETKSDWTDFSIIQDGFWWSEIGIECLEGKDSMDRYILQSEKIIKIHKVPLNSDLVKVKVTCKLNVSETHLNSVIRYRIEKGDIGYTTVRLMVEGKETEFFENRGTVSGDPNNRKDFSDPSILVRGAEPTKVGVASRLYSFLKIAGLFLCAYTIILLISYTYCYFLSLDFLQVARQNPYIFILGGAFLLAPLLTLAFKRNWI